MAHLLDSISQNGARADTPRSARAKKSGRRNFFKVLGGTGAAALVIAGCDTGDPIEDPDPPTPPPGEGVVTLDFSTDVGVLNYAYALEQLEAEFYAQAAANLSPDFSEDEAQYMEDLAAHEAIHRDFLAVALGEGAIGALEVDFTAIDFSNRMQVLQTAQVLEDTGVAAYNGAGDYFTNPGFLTLAGKIVSVEARHAAAIRAAVGGSATAFADLNDIGRGAVPDQGLDAALPPQDILAAVVDTGFVTTQIEIVNA